MPRRAGTKHHGSDVLRVDQYLATSYVSAATRRRVVERRSKLADDIFIAVFSALPRALEGMAAQHRFITDRRQMALLICRQIVIAACAACVVRDWIPRSQMYPSFGHDGVPFDSFGVHDWPKLFGVPDREAFEELAAAFRLDDDEITARHKERVPFRACFLAFLALMHFSARVDYDVTHRLCVNWRPGRTSAAINGFVDRIMARFGHLLPLDARFFENKVQLEWAKLAIATKKPRLDNVVGLIDATSVPIARPTGAIDQNIHYSGHESVSNGAHGSGCKPLTRTSLQRHVIRFQGVLAPNGLLVSFWGPFQGTLQHDFQSCLSCAECVSVGASNDKQLFNASELSPALQACMPVSAEPYLIYGDAGYYEDPVVRVPKRRTAFMTLDDKVKRRTV